MHWHYIICIHTLLFSQHELCSYCCVGSNTIVGPLNSKLRHEPQNMSASEHFCLHMILWVDPQLDLQRTSKQLRCFVESPTPRFAVLCRGRRQSCITQILRVFFRLELLRHCAQLSASWPQSARPRSALLLVGSSSFAI